VILGLGNSDHGSALQRRRHGFQAIPGVAHPSQPDELTELGVSLRKLILVTTSVVMTLVG
jgi:hypothetical protein